MTTHENLGPAERIIQTLLTQVEHAVHNRPGLVTPDAASPAGVKWSYATYKVEGTEKVVYLLQKVGNKTTRVRIGTLRDDGTVWNGTSKVGDYRKPGLFPEVAAHVYRQIAAVWNMDHEFAAHWGSYQFFQENRDLKVLLAAFLLVQSRKGDPVVENGKVAFKDEDYRDVAEAMMLIYDKSGKDLNPKLLLRIYDILSLPEVAAINRELGFGKSARKPFYGRWEKTVHKWLEFREQNPNLLKGLVKAGFRTTVMELARRSGYKPETERFFEILRWKQCQAQDGRRTMAIGKAVVAAESWEGLSETQVCEKVVKEKPNYKRLVGLVPKAVGITRAVLAAAIESGCLSDKDLIIASPTLEELGLLNVQEIKDRLAKAIKNADDMRAANIAQRMKSQQNKELVQEAADEALKKVGSEVTKGIRVYCMVDCSGSMEGAIQAAKTYLAKFIQAFPPEQIHISTFNTAGREVVIKHQSAAGVENAFRGIGAGGGTSYGAGIRALQHHKPKPEEDVLFFFFGDEEASTFETEVRSSGLNPMAFGFVKTVPSTGAAAWRAAHYAGTKAVRQTAANLGIPCFLVSEETFSDVYAIPRTIRQLVASTPVGNPTAAAPKARKTLVEQILATPLLQRPSFAL